MPSNKNKTKSIILWVSNLCLVILILFLPKLIRKIPEKPLNLEPQNPKKRKKYIPPVMFHFDAKLKDIIKNRENYEVTKGHKNWIHKQIQFVPVKSSIFGDTVYEAFGDICSAFLTVRKSPKFPADLVSLMKPDFDKWKNTGNADHFHDAISTFILAVIKVQNKNKTFKYHIPPLFSGWANTETYVTKIEEILLQKIRFGKVEDVLQTLTDIGMSVLPIMEIQNEFDDDETFDSGFKQYVLWSDLCRYFMNSKIESWDDFKKHFHKQSSIYHKLIDPEIDKKVQSWLEFHPKNENISKTMKKYIKFIDDILNDDSFIAPDESSEQSK